MITCEVIVNQCVIQVMMHGGLKQSASKDSAVTTLEIVGVVRGDEVRSPRDSTSGSDKRTRTTLTWTQMDVEYCRRQVQSVWLHWGPSAVFSCLIHIVAASFIFTFVYIVTGGETRHRLQ